LGAAFSIMTGWIMTQNILNFNLSSTDEKLTPRAGTIILGEYLKGLGLESLSNSNLPLSNSNNAYDPFICISAYFNAS